MIWVVVRWFDNQEDNFLHFYRVMNIFNNHHYSQVLVMKEKRFPRCQREKSHRRRRLYSLFTLGVEINQKGAEGVAVLQFELEAHQ